jgi:hypothetical protein
MKKRTMKKRAQFISNSRKQFTPLYPSLSEDGLWIEGLGLPIWDSRPFINRPRGNGFVVPPYRQWVFMVPSDEQMKPIRFRAFQEFQWET